MKINLMMKMIYFAFANVNNIPRTTVKNNDNYFKFSKSKCFYQTMDKCFSKLVDFEKPSFKKKCTKVCGKF